MPVKKVTTNLKIEKPEAADNDWEASYWRLASIIDLWFTQLAKGHTVTSGGNLTLNVNDIDLDVTEVAFAGGSTFSLIAQTAIAGLVTGNTYVVYVDNAGALQVSTLSASGLWSGSLPSDFVLMGLVYEVEAVWTIHSVPLNLGRGLAQGVAALDGAGDVPIDQMPNAYLELWARITAAINLTVVDVGFGASDVNAVGLFDGLSSIVTLVAGNSGNLSTSNDLQTWTARVSQFGADHIYGLATQPESSNAVIVGAAGKLSESSDGGTTWTARVSQFGADTIRAVAYGNGLWVAVGDNGKISTSPDRITWTARVSNVDPATAALRCVVWDGAKWWAGGDTANIVESADGLTWTLNRTFGVGAGTTHYGAVVGDGLIGLATSSGILTYSEDSGVSWPTVNVGLGNRNLHALAYFGAWFAFTGGPAVGNGGLAAAVTPKLSTRWHSHYTGPNVHAVAVVNNNLLGTNRNQRLMIVGAGGYAAISLWMPGSI